jgi:hypothetical protein
MLFETLPKLYFFNPCLNCNTIPISLTPGLFSNLLLMSTPKKSGASQMLNREQNPEECDATDDDSSNAVG